MTYYNTKFGDPASISIKDIVWTMFSVKIWKQNGRQTAIFASTGKKMDVSRVGD